jgi:hypothetical protein
MHFKHAMLDAEYCGIDQRHGFYLDICNRIASALMKPPSAALSFFLWDCDTQDGITLAVLRSRLLDHTNIMHEYPQSQACLSLVVHSTATLSRYQTLSLGRPR